MKLALIVDCGFGDLKASEVSVARLATSLQAHEFTVCIRRGKAATRAGVDEWIRVHAGPLGRGDAFAFAYVGHGAKIRDPTYHKGDLSDAPRQADVLLLVTHDVLPGPAGSASCLPPDHEAGITGVDLLEWLRPVAAATDNVTIILDCCHSTGLVRCGPSLDPSARTAYDAAHARAVSQLRAHNGGALRGHLESYKPVATPDRRIVRLVATSQDGVAVERAGVGLFSDALARSLAAPDAGAITWDDHIVAIRAWVTAHCEIQHPAVEGPRDRYPFSTRTGKPTDSASAVPAGEARTFIKIVAGQLHGVERGDTFRIEHAADPSVHLGDARVLSVSVHEAILEPAPRAVPVALRAVPIRRANPIPVAVDPDPAMLVHLAPDRLARIGVALVPRSADTPADTLELRDRSARLHTRDGQVIFASASPDDPRLFRALWRLAHFRRVERNAERIADAPVDPAVKQIEVEPAWGLAGQDAFTDPRPSIPAGSAVWLRLENASHATLFVDVFHLRADCSIRHLTAEFDHGDLSNRSVIAEPTRGAGNADNPWLLPWPAHIPHHAPVQERLMLVFSPRPRSLHGVAFESTRILRREPSASRLESLPSSDGPPLIKFLEFRLSPVHPK